MENQKSEIERVLLSETQIAERIKEIAKHVATGERCAFTVLHNGKLTVGNHRYVSGKLGYPLHDLEEIYRNNKSQRKKRKSYSKYVCNVSVKIL